MSKKSFIVYLPYFAWVQSLLAMFGSLYFSEILKLPPCVLCWYQRILMYPLTVIIAVGIVKKDKNLKYYVLPFSILGMAVALYQNLLYYGIIPETVAPCTAGVSCTAKLIDWFGFVTIPMLSFAAFAFITVCFLLYSKLNATGRD